MRYSTEIITCPLGQVCVRFHLSELGFHLSRAIGLLLMSIPVYEEILYNRSFIILCFNFSKFIKKTGHAEHSMFNSVVCMYKYIDMFSSNPFRKIHSTSLVEDWPNGGKQYVISPSCAGHS
jgi:hypothetical protein